MFFLPMCIILHFHMLNFMHQLSDHSISLLIAVCRQLISSIESDRCPNLVSSANLSIMNSKGPKTDPWETPFSTLAQSELHPFRTVLCFLPVNQESVHFNKSPLIPSDSILASNLLCGTLSKALLKSRYKMST